MAPSPSGTPELNSSIRISWIHRKWRSTTSNDQETLCGHDLPQVSLHGGLVRRAKMLGHDASPLHRWPLGMRPGEVSRTFPGSPIKPAMQKESQKPIQWFQSRWHKPQDVLYISHLWGMVPLVLSTHYILIWLRWHNALTVRLLPRGGTEVGPVGRSVETPPRRCRNPASPAWHSPRPPGMRGG